MTRTEEIEHEIALLQREKAEEERRETSESLRASFQRLADDDLLPVHEIVSKTLGGCAARHGDALNGLDPDAPSEDERVAAFAERLTKLIDCHRRVASRHVPA